MLLVACERNEEPTMNLIPWDRQSTLELKKSWQYLAWAALFVGGLAWVLSSIPH
jgi:hypothetical protein